MNTRNRGGRAAHPNRNPNPHGGSGGRGARSRTVHKQLDRSPGSRLVGPQPAGRYALMLNTIAASMQSARQLLAATETAGGQVPPVLSQIVSGYDLLTAEHLDQLCADAAQAEAAHTYRTRRRGHAEGLFTERFFKALCDGAADVVLDSLREPFTEAAQALAEALKVVDINVPAAQLAEHGSPQELQAWRSVRPAVQKLDEIGAIAKRFGSRSIDWAVLDRPNALDDRGVTDEATMLTDAPLIQAGAVFQRRTADLKTVPWLHLPARLNTIDQAKQRLQEWASQAWSELNAQPGRGKFVDNKFVPDVRKNPFSEKAGADA